MAKGDKSQKNMRLYLIDASGYIFRAYHALPPLTRKSDALPVGAVAGFCNMIGKLIHNSDATHIAAIFDASGRSFRNEIYGEYKANRGEPPEDLVPQFPLTRDAARAFNLPVIEREGFEADDLIASYAKQAQSAGGEVVIVSSDKDLMQLVGNGISMLDTMKDKRINEPEVKEKFGVAPERVVDVQALAGDSSDNVPGVPGIGVKTAAELINHYGDLETLLANAGEIKQNKRRENLLQYAEQARISYRLVELKQDVAGLPAIDEFAFKKPEAADLIGFLKAMEFNTITTRMAERYGFDADEYEAVMPAGAADESKTKDKAEDGAEGKEKEEIKKPKAKQEKNYELVQSEAQLKQWIARAHEAGRLAIDTETDGLDSMRCNLVGISLAVEPHSACYIPLAHYGEGLALEESEQQMPLKPVLALLKPLLADDSVLKILQNAKFDMQILSRYGVAISPIDDTMLLAYALYAGQHGVGMDFLSTTYLDHKPIGITSLIGTGKKQITFAEVPLDKARDYAAEDADITLQLWQCLKPRLRQEKLCALYETSERALVPILCEMERAGVLVDKAGLAALSQEFAQKLADLEARIYELAGEAFNIASPKQLAVILFDKHKLSAGKKTKGGNVSTDSGVLENLAHEGSQLAEEVLAWRALAKLKSTYTDALPSYINDESGRIHTSYAPAATSTGRLSSSDPNLQNIPIRTADGRRIRECFIAAKDCVLVSADYSQIELRLLAHIADIGALKSAFAEGQDIHALTASEIFGVPLKDMTSEIRRSAKAINFGIIYGISAFGLAKQLGIARGEAADYIASYFKKFPGIKDYMEATKTRARECGYVETLFGRRIWVREIDARLASRRAFAERAAINAPIQGSAADIIRRAMVMMPACVQGFAGVQMLMQVHDELVFEVPQKSSEEFMARVKKLMEEACAPRLTLSVPLVVDVNCGANWDAAH